MILQILIFYKQSGILPRRRRRGRVLSHDDWEDDGEQDDGDSKDEDDLDDASNLLR